MASGRWPDFVHMKAELKSQGVPNVQAHRQAIAHFLGSAAVKVAGRPRKQKSEPDLPEAPLTALAPEVPSPVPAPVAVGGDALNRPGAPIPIEPANLADFGGREASTAECIRWVARYMDVSDVSPKDCPDPAAWSLLCACRRSPLVTASFWQNTWPKTIEKADLSGDRDEGAVDGSKTVGMIEKIMGLALASIEQSRDGEARTSHLTHAQETAGSNPAPATSQRAA